MSARSATAASPAHQAEIVRERARERDAVDMAPADAPEITSTSTRRSHAPEGEQVEIHLGGPRRRPRPPDTHGRAPAGGFGLRRSGRRAGRARLSSSRLMPCWYTAQAKRRRTAPVQPPVPSPSSPPPTCQTACRTSRRGLKLAPACAAVKAPSATTRDDPARPCARFACYFRRPQRGENRCPCWYPDNAESIGRTRSLRLNRVLDGARATVLAKIGAATRPTRSSAASARRWSDAIAHGRLGPGRKIVEPPAATPASRSPSYCAARSIPD